MYDEIDLFETALVEDQADMLKYLIKGNGLVLMGTGMGKTYATLCSFAAFRKLYGKHKLIVIGNKNSMNIWRKEINERTPFQYSVYTSQDRRLEPIDCIDIFITQYNLIRETLEYSESLFSSYKIILVIDEVHKAKSPLTDLTLSLKMLIKRSKCVWGLTATLMNTHLEDIYHVMNLFYKKPFKNISVFRKTFIIFKDKRTQDGVSYKEVEGYKNLDFLHKILQSYIYMRFIPMPVIFKTIRVELGELEYKNYILAAQGIIGLDTRNFVSRLHDLQHVADNSIGEGRLINKSTKHLGAKEEKLLEVLQNYLLQDKAVIVYTYYKKTLLRLKNVINTKFDMNVKIITGDTSEKKRREVESTLQERDVVLMTGAGGESLNLQASGVMIFYSIPFSIITFIQVVGRIVRMDSAHKEMLVCILEANETIDTYKRLYLNSNADLISTVIAPNPNLPEVKVVPSKKYIIKLRKDLLWKVKHASAMGLM